MEPRRSLVLYILYHLILIFIICDSPANAQELFNLRHTSARNIVERMFGILKNHFAILRSNPNLDVDIQAKLAPALAAIHNLIRKYDAEDIQELLNHEAADQATLPEHSVNTRDLALGPARTAE